MPRSVPHAWRARVRVGVLARARAGRSSGALAAGATHPAGRDEESDEDGRPIARESVLHRFTSSVPRRVGPGIPTDVAVELKRISTASSMAGGRDGCAAPTTTRASSRRGRRRRSSRASRAAPSRPGLRVAGGPGRRQATGSSGGDRRSGRRSTGAARRRAEARSRSRSPAARPARRTPLRQPPRSAGAQRRACAARARPAELRCRHRHSRSPAHRPAADRPDQAGRGRPTSPHVTTRRANPSVPRRVKATEKPSSAT